MSRRTTILVTALAAVAAFALGATVPARAAEVVQPGPTSTAR
jgi:hypothetical protein